MSGRLSFRALYEHLSATVPCGQWWPAESPFEVLIGAVLTQNTAWTNVERALDNLRAEGMLSSQALLALPPERLATLIRPSGYMNVKARYLHHLCRWYEQNDEAAAAMSTPDLRESLLSVHGVGPETADDIVLYAYDRPAFIWDLYARRLFTHLGYSVPSTYEAARRSFEAQVVASGFSVRELQHFHGLIVEVGKLAAQEGGYGVASDS